VTVPNLIGMQLDTAQTQYTDITIVKSNTTYDDSAPEGQIIKQNPVKNTKVKKSSEVKVTVSLGPQKITVPDVTNRSKTEAETELNNSGFSKFDDQPEYSDVAAGYVIKTSPAAGEQAAKSDTITLVISLGTDTSSYVEVPSIVGKTTDQATRLIQDAGLVAGTPTSEYSSTVASGKVISQAKDSGTKVAPKTTIDFVVSKGPQPSSSSAVETTTVPYVVGYSFNDAESLLTDQGLKYSLTYAYSDTVDVNVVISQGKKEGSTVDVGTAINLVISRGPEPQTSSDVSASSDTSS
jgi:serine/threonine-protein kinase